MLKKIMLVSLSAMALLSEIGAATDDNIRLVCSHQSPSVQLAIETLQQDVHFRIASIYGAQFMPVFEGILTPAQLNWFSERARILAKAGSEWRAKFTRASCRVQGPRLFHCSDFSQPTSSVDGHQVAIRSVWTALSKETSFAGEYTIMKVTFSIEIDGEIHYSAVTYPADGCSS